MKTIYEMSVEELIKNKDTILTNLTTTEMDFKTKEANLHLKTNFKKLGLTNERQRNSHVHNLTKNEREAVERYKNSLTIINDLIRLRLTEMEVKD